MSTIEIRYEAKCKHCKNKEAYMKGKLKRHKCGVDGTPIKLRDKACVFFEL